VKGSIVVLALIAAAPALAQDIPPSRKAEHHIYESPQNFAIELRFGPYRADVDSDPALTGTPYADIFGTSPSTKMGLELDWQLLRIPYVGTLGPGVGLGYTSKSAKAPLSGSKELSGQDTSLNVFPFWAVAVLRADVFTKQWKIPLVPYGKAGVGFAFWRSYTDAGTSSAQGVAAKGHTWGTYLGVGLAFHLNVLDEYTARNFDSTFGVNNTYFFGEIYSLDLTGFGAKDALRVGSTTWALGLAFEF
jgi:hypothetical protein